MNKTEAVSYLRVSGVSQVDGDGFPRQREAINRYANANNIHIAGEFAEPGISGTTELSDRVVLSSLMSVIKEGGIKLVLIERADRLARDLTISEIILAEFRKLGVTVIAADSGMDLTVDSGDPTKVLIRQILGALAQWEKSCLVAKLRAAKIRSGVKEGRKPFGFLPGEPSALDYMKRRRADGLSYGEIAQLLETLQFKPRSSKRWHAATVRKILDNQPQA